MDWINPSGQPHGGLACLQAIICSLVLCCCCSALGGESDSKNPTPQLQVAAMRVAITPQNVIKTNSAHLPKKAQVASPLKATVTLLDDGETRLCFVCCDWVKIPRNVTEMFRRALAIELKISNERVLLFASHNHSDAPLITNESSGFEWGLPPYEGPAAELNEIGRQLLDQLVEGVGVLETQLQPVTIWWAVAEEDRITYNRKGRRADGSTFFMREEDRVLEGDDFNGDIDTQAPVIVFKNQAGQAVAAWVQFTGHPVTSYSPENPVIFGDYPQIACDVLGKALGNDNEIPVAFFQGCAGDVNSKEMFRGGVERATEFGKMLGQSYIDALPELKQSARQDLAFTHTTAMLPLGDLPSVKSLRADLAEIDDFITRARAGDESTLQCVGLNFPRALTPAYRAGLVDRVRLWTTWALKTREAGETSSLPDVMPVEMWIARLGDIGLVGMPLEPFQGIGRQIRAQTQLPLVIACGYANFSIGYIPDSSNLGDGEYMSSFHRYTAVKDPRVHPRPPLADPGGDVLAETAVDVLNEMAQEK